MWSEEIELYTSVLKLYIPIIFTNRIIHSELSRSTSNRYTINGHTSSFINNNECFGEMDLLIKMIITTSCYSKSEGEGRPDFLSLSYRILIHSVNN